MPRSSIPASPEQQEAGRNLIKSVSKGVCLRELRALQEAVYRNAIEPKRDCIVLCSLARAFIELRNQIRVEKNLIKPGSRNISVREESSQRPRMERVSRAELDAAAEELGLIKLPKQGKTG